MNVVLLSPNFPPNYWAFADRLRARGVNVLGIGEAEHHELRADLQRALGEYTKVGSLENYDWVYRAFAYLLSRHGRVDAVESHGEHWLALEGRLREDFNIAGPRPAELAQKRSKSGMAELFAKAGVRAIRGRKLESKDVARAFAKEHGFPVLLKPDTGVGAQRTFIVETDAQLEETLAHELHDYIVQEYVSGDLFSFDGIVDRDGKIVFELAHKFSSGLAEVVRHQLDLNYYSLREMPPTLALVGRKIVAAFELRARFFHIELFRLRSGEWRALELNMRPPGGFTTDMMNWAADVDVYGLWADIIAGNAVQPSTTRRFFSAYAGRRRNRIYGASHDEVVNKLGKALMLYAEIPSAYAGVMSDLGYHFRHEDEAKVLELITFIQT